MQRKLANMEDACELIATADIVIENLIPDVIVRVDIKHAIHSKFHDALICFARANIFRLLQPLDGGLGIDGVRPKRDGISNRCRLQKPYGTLVAINDKSSPVEGPNVRIMQKN